MAGSWSPLANLEEQFNHTSAMNLMKDICHYSFYISAFYVVTIFALQAYMQDRPKYNLQGPLMVWSLLLATFSMRGFFIDGVPHLSHALMYGWKGSVCDPVLVEGQRGLWAFLFCLSKCPELVDTYFVVLRKQKLIFLHWYHHITVFVYCWCGYGYMNNAQQWFITMNYFVHSIMYLYYTVRASRLYRPPVWVNMFITSLQLLQMVIGVWVNIYVFFNAKYTPGWYCDGNAELAKTLIYAAFIMYGSYFVLFVKFFYGSYISKKSSEQKQASTRSVTEQIKTCTNGSVRTGVISQHFPMKHTKQQINGIIIAEDKLNNNLSRNGLRYRN